MSAPEAPLKKLGEDISSSEYWAGHAKDYADAISGAYHAHRLGVIRSLLPSFVGARVLDFGCGDGVTLNDAYKGGSTRRIGIEPNETLAKIAEKIPLTEILVGDVNQLHKVKDQSIDVFLALNVVAYLDENEERKFYEHMRRVVCSGGTAVISHSNTLFDLFTLNSFTVDFFKSEFSADPSTLLTKPDLPIHTTFRVRENPMTYRFKLADFGFEEQKQAFANFHETPPLLSGEIFDPNRPRKDTLSFPERERWKLPFQCSMFVSQSVRSGN